MEGSLSSTLKALRDAAGLSQAEVARRVKVSQATVSRFETGAQVPTPAQARALCRACKAPPATRRDLLEAAAASKEQTLASRPVLSKGNAWRIQRRIAAVESAASVIRGFQPCFIPGLLQTREYMRAVFADGALPDDVERSVAERLRRQDLAAGRGTRLAYVVPEGALLWMAGPQPVMTAQLASLAMRAAIGQVGVIPYSTPVGVFPTHGFALHDDAVAIVGVRTGTSFMANPVDVRRLAELWEALAAAAVWGGDAADVIGAAADRYRAL